MSRPGSGCHTTLLSDPTTEEKHMKSVEQVQLKEMPEQAESWIEEDGIVSRETTVKKVGEQVPNSELSRLAFRRQLVAQCSILVVIVGIVAWLIAA
jgi:hypothetical protein